MLDFIQLILSVYLITLIISMIIATVKFVIDTRKWHDKEERVQVFASNWESELEAEGEAIEGEVKEVGSDE